MQQINYDIVIVGGGMVGAAMALSLVGIAKRYGLSIAIIDAVKAEQSTPTAAGSLDGRATALALGSRNLLDSIGVWPSLAANAQPILDIDVSDQGQPISAQMHAAEVNQDALGYVLQNQHMGQAFWQQLTTHCTDQVSIIDQAQVTELDNRRTDSRLVFERHGEQTQVTCQLIIMADGGRSSLREGLGMGSQKQSYEQVAVVVNVVLDKPHHGLACERFTANGPMAVLPLMPDNGQSRAAIVWTQPEDREAELTAMDSEQILTELQNQIGYRMGEFRAVGERQIYPLSLSVAKEQARQGLAVIGNAAHTLHPIAGQGFNLALRGAFALAEQVHRACKDGQSIGDLTYLQAFVSDSQWDQKRTVGASDQIMKLFSNQHTAFTLGRQLGLLAMQKLPLVKTVFTRAAMGLDRPLADVLPVTEEQAS